MGELLEGLFELFWDLGCWTTGRVLLGLLTGGRWDAHRHETETHLTGLAFWVLVVLVVVAVTSDSLPLFDL